MTVKIFANFVSVVMAAASRGVFNEIQSSLKPVTQYPSAKETDEAQPHPSSSNPFHSVSSLLACPGNHVSNVLTTGP